MGICREELSEFLEVEADLFNELLDDTTEELACTVSNLFGACVSLSELCNSCKMRDETRLRPKLSKTEFFIP